MIFKDTADHPIIEELTVYPFNRAELRMADAYSSGRPPAEREVLDRSVRGRGAAYAARFRHTAEMSWRMPVLYSVALADGRLTIDHFDTIWRRLDGHSGIRQEVADRERRRARREEESGEDQGECGSVDGDGGCALEDGQVACCADHTEEVSAHPSLWRSEAPFTIPTPENGRYGPIDQAVERELIEALRSHPQRQGSPGVSIHRVREIVDKAVSRAFEDLQRLRRQSRQWEESSSAQ